MENIIFKMIMAWTKFIEPFAFAIGHRAYLCLLVLIPFINISLVLVIGEKAEIWISKKPVNIYSDDKKFHEAMVSWKHSGLLLLFLFIIFLFLYISLVIFAIYALSPTVNL